MKKDSSNISRDSMGRIRVPVSRRALAMHYFPSPTAESAVRRLTRWLAEDPTMLAELEAVGYHPRKRWMTRQEVDIFLRYFGD